MSQPNPLLIETNYAVPLGFPHEQVKKANKLHNVFTTRDEIELCTKFHEGINQGEDRETLKAQITAYINYMEATCNHAHFATDFLRNMVREGVLQPKDIDLDDMEDNEMEDEIDEPISCMHIRLEATSSKTCTVRDGVEQRSFDLANSQASICSI
ncbi:hypothetical protein L208DRAFT_1391459 [Tricholoma matsutake]|nr:hypothetical protein L208DRAFT_1391459 [Tricholoma matsutake 945]